VDGGRTDDGATIVMRRTDDDAKTVARKRDDVGSTVSASTKGSNSRFGRMQPARVLTLASAPQLGTIEERVVKAEVADDDEKPIVLSLPSGN